MTISEAAYFLNISNATLKNWIKSGLVPERPDFDFIKSLKSQIDKGEIDKLNKRANKKYSVKTFIPAEYTSCKNVYQDIKFIVHYLSEISGIDTKILYLVTAFLEIKNINKFKNRATILKIIDEYNFEKNKVDASIIKRIKPFLKNIVDEDVFDVLGLIYQSLQNEGKKSSVGSYYTPPEVIDSMLQSIPDNAKTVIDPACGTGAILLRTMEKLALNPQNITGTDIDKNAVFLTKLNILFAYPDYTDVPNIYHFDFIESDLSSVTKNNGFDIVITNPPWAAVKKQGMYETYAEILKSREIASMFLLKSYDILNYNGRLIFLLPESILKVKTHKQIRKFLLENTDIQKIQEFGRVFSGVYTPVVSLTAKKSISKSNKIKIITQERSCEILQSKFLDSPDIQIQTLYTPAKLKLIEKLFSIPHNTLKDNAQWALGIVTGNNKKFLSDRRETDNEVVITGKDLNAYTISEPTKYIYYNREKLQQVAKEEYYRAKEKLIYKFISNKLVFSYDNSRSLTLNSANILIPELKTHSMKVVLAYLNSDVFQFIFKNMFATHKVLRKDIEKLAFPLIDKLTAQKLEMLVELQLSGFDVSDKINLIINRSFKLTKKEWELIKYN